MSDEIETGEQETVPGHESELADKSQEELIKMVQSGQEQIGKLSNEFGTLKEELERVKTHQPQAQAVPPQQDNYYPTYYPQNQYYPPQYYQQQYYQPQEPDWTDPAKAVQQLVSPELNSLRSEVQQSRIQDNVARTRAALTRGMDRMQGKKMFEGIEQDVYQVMANFAVQQAQLGQPVDAQLEDPKIWEKAALSLRHDRDQLDKVIDQQTVGAPAAEMPQTPSGDQEGSLDVTLDAEDRKWMTTAGLSEKEAIEIIGEEMKQREKLGVPS